MAFTGTPMPMKRNERPSSSAWLVDRTGRTIAHRELSGRVKFISSDGQCVLLNESGKQGLQSDLVGRDLRLTEIWRFQDVDRVGVAWAKTDDRALSRGLLLQHYDGKVRASRLPGCSAPIVNRQ